MIVLVEKAAEQKRVEQERAFRFWSDVAVLDDHEQQDFVEQLWYNALMPTSKLYDFLPTFFNSLFSIDVQLEASGAEVASFISYKGPSTLVKGYIPFVSPQVDTARLPNDDLVSLFAVHSVLMSQVGDWKLSFERRSEFVPETIERAFADWIICGYIEEGRVYIGVKKGVLPEKSEVWLLKKDEKQKLTLVDLLGQLVGGQRVVEQV